jgi:flagellar FliL protein
MSEDAQGEEARGGKKPLVSVLAGVFLALALGAGGFYAAYSGVLAANGGSGGPLNAGEHSAPLGDVAFVAVEPMVISLGREGSNRHLRFRAQLEVPQGHKADVERLLPRVTDVFNSYLRAVGMAELEEPSKLARLRAQMLRRVQMVVGRERVNDLLIMEFVLN